MSVEYRSNRYEKLLGDWKIDKVLGTGSGGKSVVFRLKRQEEDWEEYSALKVVNLLEEQGAYDTFSKFRQEEYNSTVQNSRKAAAQEVRLMEQLRGNTNIVDYLDYRFENWSDENGFGCDMLIRMELLNGLRTEIRRGKIFDREEIIKLGKDICTALVLCHKKGILHRDIKPENIFFNNDGNYKLGDFGVSRIVDSSPSAAASTGVGTPEYAAPEQFSGKHDKRVDIYSLGLVLYELSNNNRLPFATTSYIRPEELQKRQLGVALPVPAKADKALAEVILKACAYDPADRYQTAQAFLDALSKLEKAAPVVAAQPQPENYGTISAASGYATTPGYPVQTPPPATPPRGATPKEPKKPKKGSKKWIWILLAILAVALCAAVLLKSCGSEPAEEEECSHRWVEAEDGKSKECKDCGLVKKIKTDDTEESTDESTDNTEDTENTDNTEDTEPEPTDPPEPQKSEKGTYTMTTYVENGVEYGADDVFDEVPELVLNGDGTGTLTAWGGTQDMEYDNDYIWPVGKESDKEQYEIKGDIVRIYNDEIEMIFAKGGSSSGNQEEFEGSTYYCTGASVDGEMYGAADIEMEEAYFTITGKDTAVYFDGKKVYEMEFNDECVWDVNCPEDTIQYEYSGNTITLIGDGIEVYFEK